MGIFSNSSPFDTYVERTTSEKNTSDDWSQIIDVCDRVKESQNGPKDCLKSISKRLSNDNPRVVLQTITLLDACINNCGRKFLLEVAGRDFEQELQKLITSSRTHPKVSQRLKESLKKWVESEFKGDPELSLIPALYAKLQKEGCEFEFSTDSPKKVVKYSSDPNVVHSAQEEEDIAKAIQLSLQEPGTSSFKSSNQGGGGPRSTASGLYSSASAALASDAVAPSPVPEKEPTKVRALYDFEAAEDNELTFKAGEIIIILDNSDANWWKGTNHRGEGLFPANFVTTNLDGDIVYEPEVSGGKRVSFSECVEVTEVEETPSEVNAEEVTGEIDESKIDQLLHLLHEADPTGERNDDNSIPLLEEQVNAMAPSIDAELECIDKKHMQLARISTDLVEALNLYHQLMREMPSPLPYYSPYSKMMPPPGSHQYHPTNPQNMQPQSMYPQNQYASYMGSTTSGMHQFIPPHMAPPSSSGHIGGSPSHHQGAPQPGPSNFQPIQNNGGSGPMPNFSHFNQGSEFAGMPNEHMQNNMAPSSSSTPGSSQQSGNVHHGFPQGHMMNISSQGGANGINQGPTTSLPHQGPLTSMSHQGHPTSIPIQAPLTNMPHQGPTSMPHQGPTSMPHQGPPTNVPHQVPTTSMPHQGPPTSMPHQGPPTNMPHQGPIGMPHQGPPTSMPHENLPNSMSQQGPPASMPHQVPPTSIPHQGPPVSIQQQAPLTSMSVQGPPTSMSFYTPSPMQSMQQPLL